MENNTRDYTVFAQDQKVVMSCDELNDNEVMTPYDFLQQI